MSSLKSIFTDLSVGRTNSDAGDRKFAADALREFVLFKNKVH
jgi:hypothetical protein